MAYLPTCIVACGSRKQTKPSVAKRMYTGQYYKSCMAFAQNCTVPERIFLMSPKYGFLRTHDWVVPYALKWGMEEVIGMGDLLAQVEEKKINFPKGNVVVLGGREYIEICQEIWPDCLCPLNGRGKIGRQIQWMRDRIEEGNVFHWRSTL